jgi:hypothetical protein
MSKKNCPICDYEVRGDVGKAAHMRLSHPKAMNVSIGTTFDMSYDDKREAIRRLIEFHCGGTIPGWWVNLDAAVDVFDLYGQDDLILLARRLMDEDMRENRDYS